MTKKLLVLTGLVFSVSLFSNAFTTPTSFQKRNHLRVHRWPSELFAFEQNNDGTESSPQTRQHPTPSPHINRRAALSTTATTMIGGLSSSSAAAAAPAAAGGGGVEGERSASTTSGGVPNIKLGKSNLSVSRTIQGHWQLAGGHGRYNAEDAIQNMAAHYNAGITTLDTADIYGPSELIVGRFVATQPESIPCTKFCCFRYLEEIDRDEVITRINKQRERLQVDKLPLVQFFWSDYNVKRYVDVALMLTELKEKGYIQQIGATNFDLTRLKELKAADVPIVSHQVQLSALDQRPVQSGMADWCADNQISLIAFGTVGSGILSARFLDKPPPTQEQRNTASLRMYTKTAERFGDWNLVQNVLNTMDVIATDIRSTGRCAKATIANVAQRYVLDTPAVASIIIGVRNQDHIHENVRTHSFVLTDAERRAIDDVLSKRSGPRGDVWDLERGTLREKPKK